MVYGFEGVPWKLKTIWAFNELADHITQILAVVNKRKFDALIMPLFPPNIVRIGDINDFINHSYIKSDLELQNGQNDKIHIRLSPLDIAHADKQTRSFNRKLLKQEIDYAAYLGVPTIIISMKQESESEEKYILNKYVSFIKKIKVKNFFETNNICLDLDINKQWSLYNEIRILTKFNLPIMLRVTKEMPNRNDQRRWLAENVRFILLNQDKFHMNDQGAPILNENHTIFLTSAFSYEPYIVMEGSTPKYDLMEHRNFMIHLFKNQKPLTEQAYMAADYYDQLQVPLQPYKDNLSAGTYETFEQDKIKYDLYEEAIKAYLQTKGNQQITILMAGAGRGGILGRVIQSVSDLKCKAKIVAVEKNPYAYMSLIFMQNTNPKWKNVIILNEDLKTWQSKETFDLIVSELLGSFGDNELSPECLKWAQKHLKPDAISIPCNSNSFVVPVSCPTLHDTIKYQYGDLGFHTSYVVCFHKYYTIPDIQKVFTFQHPDFENKNQLNQEKSISFEYKQENLIHGFCGYFTSELYKNISLSILPANHTEDMFSWFPIYFPLDKPIKVDKKQKLIVTFIRCNNEEIVWYEWKCCVYEGDQLIYESVVHNKNGIKQKIMIK